MEMGPVVPIVPFYNLNEDLCEEQLSSYIDFLIKGGLKIFMTTIGTSQFNLLNLAETRHFNLICSKKIKDYFILGIPPLSLKHALEEVIFYNNVLSDNRKTFLLLFYPDRFYNFDNILEYFYEIANVSQFPILIHGMPMRHGLGGNYNYDHNLINCLAQHKNIVGIKEESPSFDLGFDLCQKIENKDFITIVAGKSQRRFLSLFSSGAKTFLTGIGNIFPKIAVEFYDSIINNDLEKASLFVKDFETPFFNVFMDVGWHKALRYAIELIGFNTGNRKPFPICSIKEKKIIEDIVFKIQKERDLNG